MNSEFGGAIAEAAAMIKGSVSVAALTGAGISTESGIPDFRGPNGLWTKDPEAEKLSDIRWYMGDPDVRRRAWQARLSHPVWDAKPNAGHLALAELERKSRLHSLATQNVDGLHQMAGSSPDVVIELHGSIHEVMCMTCSDRAPMLKVLERVRAGEEDPHCKSCGGILKSATVSFGQTLDPVLVERAFREAGSCQTFLAIGTSLAIYPAAGLPEAALFAGANLIIINEQPTPYDSVASLVIRARTGEVLDALAGGL